MEVDTFSTKCFFKEVTMVFPTRGNVAADVIFSSSLHCVTMCDNEVSATLLVFCHSHADETVGQLDVGFNPETILFFLKVFI